jgi:hypothetical protein
MSCWPHRRGLRGDDIVLAGAADEEGRVDGRRCRVEERAVHPLQREGHLLCTGREGSENRSCHQPALARGSGIHRIIVTPPPDADRFPYTHTYTRTQRHTPQRAR